MVSDDFLIEPSDDCARYGMMKYESYFSSIVFLFEGISHSFVKAPTEWMLKVSYPKASFSAIITHMVSNETAMRYAEI